MTDIAYFLELLFFFTTVPLYIFVLICLFKEWRTKNGQEPFFKLCFVNGILDIVLLMNNNILNVMPKACILPDFFAHLGAPVLHFYFILAWGGGVCQGLCVVIIAFNRLTIIIYPDKAKRIWKSSNLIYFYFLQIVPGLLCGSVTLFVNVIWDRKDDCTVIGYINNADVTRVFFEIAAFYLFSIAAALILIYGAIFYKIKKLHRKNFLLSISRNKKIENMQVRREFRLLTMSAIICALQLLYTVYIVVREIFKLDTNYIGYNFFMDFCTGVNPYLLLIFSNSVRTQAKEILGLKSKGSSMINLTVPHSKSGPSHIKTIT